MSWLPCQRAVRLTALASDLSSTGLRQLPSVGLDQLRELIIRDTYALKRIPSIYSFPELREAHLTYAYHCCSFRYPRAHDPSAYEQHLADWSTKCAGRHLDLAEPITEGFEGDFSAADSAGHVEQREPPGEPAPPALEPADLSNLDQPSAKSKLAGYKGASSECNELTAQLSSGLNNISCTPEPDAFNPCEDIMGYPVLRVAVWFVVGASVFGNLSVIVVLANIFKRLSVPKFLQLNLAIGDLFMGVYLALLALADLNTLGSYFNYAIDWQHGYGCKIAGAASLFASQLSIFSLSVITFERYYTITYSIDLNMRLQLGWAARIMFLGWIYAFASAMLPIFADVNSYSKTSICLPMRTKNLNDRVFLAVLLVIDSSAFVIIFACYLKMYLLILRQKTEATAKERTVAMRMALFVSTDFACWAPIIFFGTTALLGKPLISVTNSKILIVFFYPLNSMANPFLYVISTRQYRRDLNYLSSRLAMWRKSLFCKSNPCDYPNSSAHGVAAANQFQAGRGAVGSLHVQLGAVAAVTGIARHLHRNQFSESALDKAALAEALGSEFAPGALELVPQNLSDSERFVHTKTRSSGFVLRHQIITGNGPRYAEIGRCRRPPSSAAIRQAQLRAQRRDQPGQADSPGRDALANSEPAASRLALVAPTLSFHPAERDESQSTGSQPESRPARSQGRTRRKCCRSCCRCERARACETCTVRQRCSACPRTAAMSSRSEQQRAESLPAGSLQPCAQPHRARRHHRHNKRPKVYDEQPIDILGNLSNNDPNSSVSAVSSPQISQQGQHESAVSRTEPDSPSDLRPIAHTEPRRQHRHRHGRHAPGGAQLGATQRCSDQPEPLSRRARRVQCKRCREAAVQGRSDSSRAAESTSWPGQGRDGLSVQADPNSSNDLGTASAQKKRVSIAS